MKRFAWLWGTLLGAILLPVLMTACSYGAASYLAFSSGVITKPSNLFSLLYGLSTSTIYSRVWDGALGCCGAMLWTGHRSLSWRLLSIGVGIGATAYPLRDLWKYWHWPYGTGIGDPYRWLRLVYVANCTPLALASLLLLFFAILLRSPRPLAGAN
jgi:hypothetical protein